MNPDAAKQKTFLGVSVPFGKIFYPKNKQKVIMELAKGHSFGVL